MKTTLLQAAVGNDLNSGLSFLIVTAICIILFFVFRAVLLWYWKVDKIVENQQRQIEQMNAMINNQKTLIDALAAMYSKQHLQNVSSNNNP